MKKNKIKQIKKAIGRLNCPVEKVIPNKKNKILEKIYKKNKEE